MTTVAVCQSKTESYNKAHKDDIIAAYNDVRDDKTATNWALLDYEEGKESVFVSEKGTGGLSELKTHLGEDKAQFAFVRYSYSNDPMSQRAKFVLISWCGPKVKIMRKAKLTVQIADVKSVFKSYAVEIQAQDINDLKEDEVTKMIKKAGGANYDRQSSEY